MSLIPNDTPPVDTPPVDTPPVDTPPVDTPPVDTPPVGKYLFADGVEGSGDVPEWFKGDKYKTVSAQAEAYTELTELESKFGSFSGSPKDGKYEIEGVNFEENELMGVVAQWGVENQLSQDGLEGLFAKVGELSQQQQEADSQVAKEALGDRADQRLSDLASWGKNNLSAEEYEQFQGLVQTAGHVEVLEKMIGMAKNSKMIEATPTSPTKSYDDRIEEVKKMQLAVDGNGRRLMETDPGHRKKVNAAYKAIEDGQRK